MLITQISKNNTGTGLSNVISYLYANKNTNEKITITFNTSEGIKSLTLYWKIITTPTETKRGYAYIIPKEVSSTNKDEEFFASTQDKFLPAITNTLFQMWFKDSTIDSFLKDKRESIQVKDFFQTELPSFGEISHFNFDDMNKTIEEKKERRLWVLEILHKIFNSTEQIVAWPNEIEYKTITDERKKIILPEKVKKIHLYKKLMGQSLIDSPIQELTSLQISTSSFNVVANGNQPLVIETIDGKFIESKQFRKKILISNGEVRVPYLYATLTQDIFNEFVKNEILKDEVYLKGKFYKIPLKNSVTGDIIPLVSKKILQIPQEEIVNLVNEIEILKIRQTVYKSKIKDINKLIGDFQESITPDFIKFNKEYGIDEKGFFNVKSEEDDSSRIKDTHITNNISLSVLKFPTTETTTRETIILNNYLNITTETSVTDLLVKKKDLISKLEEIKSTLEEKRYKLSLISYTLFLNGFTTSLKYDVWTDGKVDIIEKSNAAGVVDGIKNARIISSKDGKIKVKIQLFKTKS